MIRYLLDTGVTSQAGKQKPNKNARKWLDSVNDDQLAISVITLRERLEGAERAKRMDAPSASDIVADVEDLVHAYDGRILPIDENVARRWAKLLVPDNSRSDDKAQIAIAGSTWTDVGDPELEGCPRPRRIGPEPGPQPAQAL